jgi:hypothetical protein
MDNSGNLLDDNSGNLLDDNSVLFVFSDIIRNPILNRSASTNNDFVDLSINSVIDVSDISLNYLNALVNNTILVNNSNLLYGYNNNNNNNYNNYNNYINDFIDSTLNNVKPVYKKIASATGLKQVEEVEYKESHYSQTMCPIYCVSFTEDEIICKLPCNHVFSHEGIHKWLRESNQCPVCRFELEYQEVRDCSSLVNSIGGNDLSGVSEYTNQYHLFDEMTGITGITGNNNYVVGDDVDAIHYVNNYPRFNLIDVLLRGHGLQSPVNGLQSPVNGLQSPVNGLQSPQELEDIEYQEAILRSLRDV